MTGLVLLLLEPALILFTLRIYDIGTMAAALWVISIVVIGRGRRKFR